MSSVLQPVDVNIGRSPAWWVTPIKSSNLWNWKFSKIFKNCSKRARYDEDVDSLDKGTKWSLNRSEVIHETIFDQGVGRLDCDIDDISTDDDTIFCRNDPGAIDVSCVSMTPNSRDKQVKCF